MPAQATSCPEETAASVLDALAGILAKVGQLQSASNRRDILAIELARLFDCDAIVFDGSVPDPDRCFLATRLSAATSNSHTSPRLIEHPLADRPLATLASTAGEEALSSARKHGPTGRRWVHSVREPNLISHVFPPGPDPMELVGIILHQPVPFERCTASLASSVLRIIEYGSTDWWAETNPHLLPGSTLSPRLRAVLDCLLEGRSEKEVASRLGIAPGTVHTYVVQLYRLHRVNSRGELLAKFINNRTNGAPAKA